MKIIAIYGQYDTSLVHVSRDGYSATLRDPGLVDLAYSSFDEAYEAAQKLGGNRWVIGRTGDSEFVPEVES